MLFSDEKVASYINNHFEAVWESARPVPLITMNFGNGKVVNRTMKGNIATYVCFADGSVLDVLPGIYEAATFNQCLERLSALAENLASKAPAERALAVQSYHRSQANSIPVQEFIQPVIAVIANKLSNQSEGSNRKNLSAWTELYQDTLANETVWRKKAHTILMDLPPHTPKTINKRIYREVLHTDLDDPYLGLGPALFGSYPFEK